MSCLILVTGARQVGKTTMLKHFAESDRTYVTMDNTMARELAQSDPVLFFQTYKPPILIDEVQKAPELFEQIKIICDESDEKGLIWLTGSQQYNMMKRVRETLAGRIGILELYSLSAREKAGLVFDTDLDFSLATLQARQRKLPKNDVVQVFHHIWEGGMPQIQGVDDELRQEYFNSYIDTYLMRDATEAGGICFGFQCFLRGTHWHRRRESVGAVVQCQTCVRGDAVLCDRIGVGGIDGRLTVCGRRWRRCRFRLRCWFGFYIARLGMDGLGGNIFRGNKFLGRFRGIGGLWSVSLLMGILFLWLLLRCDRRCARFLCCRCWFRCCL